MSKLPLESEHHMQCKIFAWAKLKEAQYPVLQWLFAVPNQSKNTHAGRVYMEKEGKRAGVPDIILPVPKYDECDTVCRIGLAIEMKRKPNKVTADQQRWLDGLKDIGWSTHVCWSFEEAIETIENYLA